MGEDPPRDTIAELEGVTKNIPSMPSEDTLLGDDGDQASFDMSQVGDQRGQCFRPTRTMISEPRLLEIR